MDFHNIQTEKAKAMARYRLLRNIAKIRLLIELLIVVFLFLWSSTHLPSVAKFARELVEFAGKVSGCLYGCACSSFVNFAVFHTIILVLFVHSCINRDGGTARAKEENSEPIVFTELDFEIPYSPTSVAGEEPEAEAEEKQIAVVENAVTREECKAVGVAIEQAKRQIRRFERTHSAILKRGKPRRGLRESGTDINAKADYNERAISVIDTVDALSSVEFQRTIDEFIAKQQRFLLAQKMEEQQLVEI